MENEERCAMCMQWTIQRQNTEKKSSQTKWKSHWDTLEKRFTYTIVTHQMLSIQSHICTHITHINTNTYIYASSANRLTNAKLKIIKIKGGDSGCQMKAFLFVSVNKQPSRDNINIKFVYPLQIWCDVFFSLSLLRSPHCSKWSSLNPSRSRAAPQMQILA